MGYSSDEATKRSSDERRAKGGNSGPSVASSLRRSIPRWRKYDHAATLAAAMSHLALRRQDRVGLMLFDREARSATRLSNNRGHWHSLVEVLAGVTFDEPGAGPDGDQASGGADFAGVFDRVIARLAQRSLVVIISDLFDDPERLQRGLAMLRHRRHDAIVLQTLDHAELHFPFRAPSEFIGLEREGRLPLDPSALRQGYLDALHSHLQRVERTTRRFRFDYLRLDTSEPLGPPLSEFLARRAAAIARG